MSAPTEPKPAGPLATPGPWDLVAEGYEQITRRFLENYSRSGLAMLSYGPETRAIDVACGPGTTALLLAPAVRHVTCVDFSARMLNELRTSAATAGMTNIDVVEADGQALPFRAAAFDIGISMFGLMFFPDRPKGFAELHRVLAPGGQALVSSWAPASGSPLMSTVIAALQPDDAPAQTFSRLSGLEDRDVFQAEMLQAGFADIRIHEVTHELPVDDVTRFWENTVRGMAPVAMMKHNSSAEEWANVERRALDRLAAALGNRLPASLGSTAYLATARKA